MVATLLNKDSRVAGAPWPPTPESELGKKIQGKVELLESLSDDGYPAKFKPFLTTQLLEKKELLQKLPPDITTLEARDQFFDSVRLGKKKDQSLNAQEQTLLKEWWQFLGGLTGNELQAAAQDEPAQIEEVTAPEDAPSAERPTPQRRAAAQPTDWVEMRASDDSTDVLVKYSLVEGDFDSTAARESIAAHIRDAKKPLRVVVADANYGQQKGDWDDKWTNEFQQTISLAESLAPGDKLKDVVFIWFLSDQQLLDAITAINGCPGLKYRLLFWSKKGQPGSGARWKNDGEVVLLAYFKELSQLVIYDPSDPLRWSTNPKFDLDKFFKDKDGDVVNGTQKPIALLQRLLYLALAELERGVILDVTCGTGTTAVTPPPLLSPHWCFTYPWP